MSRLPNESVTTRVRELELERVISLAETAELTGVSEDTIRRHHPHLIRRLSPRRVGVKLRDALAIGTPKDAA
jgi:hypothetical protein